MNKISKEDYERSVTKIKRCASKILMKGGFFGNFLSEIPIASSDECKLFSTDGSIFIFNPSNCASLSDEEIVWSINQGIIHLALQHFDRKSDKEFDMWNQACDIVSDLYLEGICKSFLREEFKNGRFANKSAEEIYEDIKNGKIQYLEKYQSNCDVLSPGEIGEESINDVIIGNVDKGQRKKDQVNNPIYNSDRREDGSNNDEGDLIKSNSSEGNWEINEEEKIEWSNEIKKSESRRREVIERIKEITERSANKGTGNGGTSPALRRFVDNLMNPQIDWRKTLRRYTSEMEEDPSVYKIPNRRHIFHDLYLPGLKGKEQGLGTVAIAIDTSGSIGQDEYNSFIEETRSVLKSFQPKEIYIIYCSDGIEPPSGDIDRLKSPNQILDQEKQRSTGGNEGGFDPPIKWVEKNLIKKGKDLACMIYFTDGGAEDPEKPNWHKKIIWALTTDRRMPFGKHINVPINKLKTNK